MKLLKILGTVLVLSTSSFATADGHSSQMLQANEQAMRAYAATHGKNTPEVTQYRYGMKLDIARVIDVTATGDSCDAMPAQMTYEDSRGTLNILEYRTVGSNCRIQN